MQGQIVGMPANDTDDRQEKVAYTCKITLQIGTHPLIYGRDRQTGQIIPGMKQLGEAIEFVSAQVVGTHEDGKGIAAGIALNKLIDYLNRVCETPVVILGEVGELKEVSDAGEDPAS